MKDRIYWGYTPGKGTELLPLGIIPKKLFYENIQRERFEQLCRVLAQRFGYCRRQGFRSTMLQPCTNAQ